MDTQYTICWILAGPEPDSQDTGYPVKHYHRQTNWARRDNTVPQRKEKIRIRILSNVFCLPRFGIAGSRSGHYENGSGSENQRINFVLIQQKKFKIPFLINLIENLENFSVKSGCCIAYNFHYPVINLI